MTRHFDQQLTFTVEGQLRQELEAISFLEGHRGMYSHPAKRFLRDGVRRFINAMTPEQKIKFDEIMAHLAEQYGDPRFGNPTVRSRKRKHREGSDGA